MATVRLQLQHTAVLVVDVQEKLVPHMHRHEVMLDGVRRLVDGANALNVPVLVTEQYPKGLGHTVPQLADALASAACRCDKLKFSACTEPVRQTLLQHQTRSVIICGIETHVCVLQTCLDLIDLGLLAAVATDAVSSRRLTDQDTALVRMAQAGVVPTTVESALLEMVHEAGGERFDRVLPIIR